MYHNRAKTKIDFSVFKQEVKKTMIASCYLNDAKGKEIKRNYHVKKLKTHAKNFQHVDYKFLNSFNDKI